MPKDYIVHKAVEYDSLSAARRRQLDTTQRQWLASPKYDGCHAVLLFEHGEFSRAMSRTGEPAPSMNHIGQLIEENWELGDGKVAVCGEAWNGKDEFNTVSGKFRKKSDFAADLGFAPFDIVTWDYNDDTTSGPCVLLSSDVAYRQRLMTIIAQFNPLHTTLTISRPLYHTGTLDEAIQYFSGWAKSLKGTGLHDGVVLADATGRYIQGAGKFGEFIKLKPLISYTVTVTGAALDSGTKTGKNTAALKFMLDGKEQKVSTGLTQEQVDEITAVGWDGYRIEVEAMGKTVNGYLREPRFKGIRTDA